jgi:hypothetical protein
MKTSMFTDIRCITSDGKEFWSDVYNMHATYNRNQ